MALKLTKTEEKQLERCLSIAKQAGVPKDQAEKFVGSLYIPLPWQWRFHAAAREADMSFGPVMIGCGGARGPGKSHAVLSQIGLDDCQRVSGLKVLFLRQTGKAAKESFEDLISKTLKGKVSYTYKAGMLRFPNGSRVLLGGFKDNKDIDKYVGIEYDLIAIEEINQLTEEKVEKLRGSLRSSKEDWRPRLYASFNPGGVGHGYVKKCFVLPFLTDTEAETRFFPSTYRDNPFLNKEYTQYLESLQGQLGQAWRDGDFDILAGQFFTEYRSEIHGIEPFDIPFDWKRVCSLDYGYGSYSSLGWWAISPNNEYIRYRELYVSQKSYSELAKEYVSRTNKNENISHIVCDPAIWNKDGHDEFGFSGAEIFERKVKELTGKTPQLVRANNDRVQGWAVMREDLKVFPGQDGSPTARIKVFNTCFDWHRTIELQVHSERNPEDLDTDLEDHAMDETRYLCMDRPKPAVTSAQKEDLLFKQAMKRKKEQGLSGKSRLVYG
jgi:phage terminase large subunit